jgi:hypothetical protein
MIRLRKIREKTSSIYGKDQNGVLLNALVSVAAVHRFLPVSEHSERLGILLQISFLFPVRKLIKFYPPQP